MAEFERALIQERVRAGLRNAKAKGRQAIYARYRIVAEGEKVSALLRMQQKSFARVAGTRRIYAIRRRPVRTRAHGLSKNEGSQFPGSLLTCFL
jgi:DNA invertase Pin-like site-specific DNA recombinase